jgi:hypothetical protein
LAFSQVHLYTENPANGPNLSAIYVFPERGKGARLKIEAAATEARAGDCETWGTNSGWLAERVPTRELFRGRFGSGIQRQDLL